MESSCKTSKQFTTKSLAIKKKSNMVETDEEHVSSILGYLKNLKNSQRLEEVLKST